MKAKIFVIILLSISFILSSCVSQHQLMVGPDGTIQDCHATGYGLIGATLAGQSVDECMSALKKAGFIEIEKAGVIGVTFRTDSTYILKVTPKSPADKAGFQPGDFISKINHQKVIVPKDAQLLLFGEARTPVKISVIRNGTEKEYDLKLWFYTEIYGRP